MKRVFKVALYVVLAIVLIGGAGLLFIQFGMPSVNAAPEITIEGTEEQVKRGEYLAVNVLNCIDCHSARDMNVFSGPTIPGTEGKGGEVFDEKWGFPGTFYSKNITPHNLGDWTDGEIYRLLTVGVNKKGEPVFPFMPYPSFRNMDQEDIKAVIAYLRTLKPIENTVADSKPDFPLNFIIRTLPADVAPAKKPSQDNQVEYGKYLVTIASCSDCHTPMEQGEPKLELFLSGGQEFQLPPFGTVRSLNITPDKETGIGNWTKQAFINRFKNPEMPHNKGLKVKPGEFQTLMPWTNYAKMTEEDLGAIYEYLMTIKPIQNKVERFTAL